MHQKSPSGFTGAAAACLMLPATASPTCANPLSADWTGLYAGVHGGANWVDVDTASLGSFAGSAATYGVHAGYNLEAGSLVAGLEADASFTAADLNIATGAGHLHLETSWSGTLRGRLGVEVGPALLYATAGYAWTALTVTEGGSGTHVERNLDGVVYGAGVEGFILPGISLKIEALRFDYGTEQLSLQSGAGELQRIDADDTVVRAGLTLHFN